MFVAVFTSIFYGTAKYFDKISKYRNKEQHTWTSQHKS